jgi:hypothetical protein
MAERHITVRLMNSLTRDLTVHLEPWGEQHKMTAGASLIIEAKGPDSDMLELEYSEESIRVYGWSGSVVSISAAGT